MFIIEHIIPAQSHIPPPLNSSDGGGTSRKSSLSLSPCSSWRHWFIYEYSFRVISLSLIISLCLILFATEEEPERNPLGRRAIVMYMLSFSARKSSINFIAFCYFRYINWFVPPMLLLSLFRRNILIHFGVRSRSNRAAIETDVFSSLYQWTWNWFWTL